MGSSLPVTDSTPSVTLPPAEVTFAAPIGDASLEYSEEAVLYMPSIDSIGLTTVPVQLSYSPVRPDAETLVRSLLAQPSSKNASSLGGNTRLSLYGTSPVEVSRNTVTVNLSASALQLDRKSLYLTCQAITNTLTQLNEIQYVNILVMNKPVGLDIGNALPMGALKYNSSQDLDAVYQQLLSRRATNPTAETIEPLSVNLTLYFPLLNTDGIVSETRSITFENQHFPDMVTTILRELASGPAYNEIHSPSLPLLADLLTTTPSLSISEEAGGNVISLDFAHNLEEMLDAYGISRKQSMASLCYTLTTFFPNVNGIRVSVNGAPIDSLLLTETVADEDQIPILTRSDFSETLFDYATLFFANAEKTTLTSSSRPMPYRYCRNPRMLLMELAKGPQVADSVADLQAVMQQDVLTDTDMLGFSLSEQTLLVNFAPSFSEIGVELSAEEERLMAYALVNTLCLNEHIKNVCFFLSGSQFDGFTGEIYWAGLFHPLPL